MSFPILNPKKPEPFEELNDKQKIKLVDINAEGWNESAIKHSKEIADLGDWHYVPTSVAKSYITKTKKITSDCENLMKGQVIITPAVIDPETWEITKPAVYKTPPKTEAELQTECFKLHEDCTNLAFNYLVASMVDHMTVEGTREAYALYFANQKKNGLTN